MFLNKNNIAEEISLCIIFFLGASGMRALGCLWNDFNDKEIDIKVTRTKDRLIASEQVTNNQIILFSSINGIIGSFPLYFLPLKMF